VIGSRLGDIGDDDSLYIRWLKVGVRIDNTNLATWVEQSNEPPTRSIQ
jgi:hypothetical protein